jgi:hypothetical protein
MRDQTWVTGDGISLDNCSLETFTIPISTNVLSSNPAEPQHYVIKSVTYDSAPLAHIILISLLLLLNATCLVEK